MNKRARAKRAAAGKVVPVAGDPVQEAFEVLAVYLTGIKDTTTFFIAPDFAGNMNRFSLHTAHYPLLVSKSVRGVLYE